MTLQAVIGVVGIVVFAIVFVAGLQFFRALEEEQ